MTDLFIEFNEASMENTGFLNPGRIKFSDQNVVFKNMKSGRMEQIQASDIDTVQWIRLAAKPAVKIITKNGSLYRFGGFTDNDFDRLKTFIKRNWQLELESLEMSVKGWNYGETKFKGSSMAFEVENQPCFEVPLQNVSNCTAGKNEIAVEFHQNDDCPVSLMEMRFHIPTTDNQSEDPVELFRKNIMQYAAIIQETGKALAVLDQILCNTPRGRYDIKLYPTFLALHGKTFDYKIPISTILRLFLLPHRDGRRMFFVISLDPPIKQGQTRYHFLICEFMKDEEIDLELGLPEEVLKEKYDGQLEREMKGPLYEVLSRIMKTLVKKKITVPGNFIGNSGTPAVSCAYKSAAGLLYPLEKGFMFVHKPPMHIRQEEVACVNFARSDVSTRTFDFEIETKNGNSFTFTSIEKEEYGKLFDYVNNKKIRIKNVGNKRETSTKENFFQDSDEDETDHYAEKLKRDAKEKEEEEEEDDDESSEDSDYDPEKDKKRNRGGDGSEPDEEFDSDASGSSGSSSDNSGDGSSSSDAGRAKKRSDKKPAVKSPSKATAKISDAEMKSESDDEDEKAAVPAKKAASKPAKTENKKGKGAGDKTTKKKKVKDPGQPKKAQSSYMFWLNENRSKIKEPGMSVVDVTKKGGQMWRELKDKTKWEKMAAEDKKRYASEMEEFKKGGLSTSKSKPASSASKDTAKLNSTNPIAAKSSEFVPTDESSSEDEKKKKSSDEKDSAASNSD